MNSERKGDWIQTHMGIKFWPLDPRVEEIHIKDIAHALSLTCRFNGHCKKFYSVAEHSVHCSRVIDNDLKLPALLHDGSEAYINDVSRPIKPYLENYREIESGITKVIGEKYNISDEKWQLVKPIDHAMLATEALQVFERGVLGWAWDPREFALNLEIKFWTPEEAESEFLKQFNQLYYE